MSLWKFLPQHNPWYKMTGLQVKSKFGHKFMYEHSMNAPQEMRQLHTEFYDFISWNIV